MAITPHGRNPPLELWGGVECTVNRVGDLVRDQLMESGHAHRYEDLDRFAELGLRTLRYPVLWERAQPTLHSPIDWTWATQRLARLQELGIRPIVGLVHHGSGPLGTQLTEESFIAGLKHYARGVAERFPWVMDYTPINEPLTTARFSGLYGHWYPHGQNPFTFQRALLTQCRAVAESMQAIREINPQARLIQTDDLGRVTSRPRLQYQADFENERRWLTWDLLCGRIDGHHPLYHYLRQSGATDRELEWFRNHPCPPDVVGINYYVTSDRYLDDRLTLYPPGMRGGNGRDIYVDIDTVRASPGQNMNIGGLLYEAMERFHLPLVVTECHLGCTREQQMRWLWDVWNTCRAEHARGVPVQAVTVWALLGLYDWNSLVTRQSGHYESGPFDLRGAQPRQTALATCVKSILHNEPVHPVLEVSGWWRKPSTVSGRKLLIAGAGVLALAFERICVQRGLAYCRLARGEMDIAETDSVEKALDLHQPWAVINAAGYSQIDPAELEPHRCRRENTTGPAILAAVCQTQGIPFVTFSSDFVFDGERCQPYVESDPVGPLNVYGQSKVDAEASVMRLMPKALIVRAGDFFGPWDDRSFLSHAIRRLATQQVLYAADDVTFSPTYLPDAVHATLDLLIDGEFGLWHLANAGEVTWADFAREAALRSGHDVNQVVGRSIQQMGYSARRPVYSALGSERGQLLSPLPGAIDRFFTDCHELPITQSA